VQKQGKKHSADDNALSKFSEDKGSGLREEISSLRLYSVTTMAVVDADPTLAATTEDVHSPSATAPDITDITNTAQGEIAA
jgi:hypothetical protein